MFSSTTISPPASPAPLMDAFGRKVRYVRLSVTDRCDFRCSYCMSEAMTFAEHKDLLTLEELERVAAVFIGFGTRKLRITGGEPLVRRNILSLFRSLSRHLETGALEELTLTTNGSQLPRYAQDLAKCGVRRVNISLDTLNPDTFRTLTRLGNLKKVLMGVDAAQNAGLRVKLNVVALKGVTENEIRPLIAFAHGRGMDLTFIEVMPMGEITAQRSDQFLSLTDVRAKIGEYFTLEPLIETTGGPARYVRLAETGGRIGFITPLSHNFCESCNRVRLNCMGMLYTCLGRDHCADLRAPLRASESDALLAETIRTAILNKPKGHDFNIARTAPAVARHMSATGG